MKSITTSALLQKTTIVSVHLLGAGLTFGCGALYILVQTGVSYHMQPRFHGRDILWARTAVGLWTMASVIICILHHTSLTTLEHTQSSVQREVADIDTLEGDTTVGN